MSALTLPRGPLGLPMGWLVTIGGTLVLAIVYRADWIAMVDIWKRSETFTHGFLILPIALYLIWRARHRLAQIAARPFWPGMIAVAACAFGWILGELASVAAVKQFAIVGMLPAMVLTVMGWRIAWALLFPLAFLLFLVPFGEFLMPAMMNHTADITIWALRASGIPVLREGLHFEIPSGRWSVVEACSGLRYLIASLVLGTLFAYLTYRSPGRRLAFIAASAIVPILANWVRAYMIVMIGHLSSMQLASGVDHLVYGWVFFGLVMAVLFWVGMRWREDDEPASSTSQRGNAVKSPRAAGVASLLVAALLAVGLAALTHRVPAWLTDRVTPRDVEPIVLAELGNWRHKPAGQMFVPQFSGQRIAVRRLIDLADDQVQIDAFYYARQRDDEEMINQLNVVVPNEHSPWRVARRGATTSAQGVPVLEYELHSSAGRLLVWQWFTVNGKPVTSAAMAKLLTAAGLLQGQGDHSMATMLSSPIGDTASAARSRLQQVVEAADRAARQATRTTGRD